MVLSALLAALIAAVVLALPPARRQPVRDSELESRVAEVLRLATYEQRYREIVYFGKEQRVLFFRTSDKEVLFGIDVVVRAGIDLSAGFEVLRDSRNSRRIYVRVPPPEILSVDARESSIEQYFVSERRGEIGFLEMADQIAGTKDEVRSRALQSGILSHAESNARQMVGNLFRMLGYDEVEIAVRSQELQL